MLQLLLPLLWTVYPLVLNTVSEVELAKSRGKACTSLSEFKQLGVCQEPKNAQSFHLILGFLLHGLSGGNREQQVLKIFYIPPSTIDSVFSQMSQWLFSPELWQYFFFHQMKFWHGTRHTNSSSLWCLCLLSCRCNLALKLYLDSLQQEGLFRFCLLEEPEKILGITRVEHADR